MLDYGELHVPIRVGRERWRALQPKASQASLFGGSKYRIRLLDVGSVAIEFFGFSGKFHRWILYGRLRAKNIVAICGVMGTCETLNPSMPEPPQSKPYRTLKPPEPLGSFSGCSVAQPLFVTRRSVGLVFLHCSGLRVYRSRRSQCCGSDKRPLSQHCKQEETMKIQ